MLILSRKRGEKIVFPDLNITITVVDFRSWKGGGERVRVGIEAPADIIVHRGEVQAAIERGEKRSSK